MTPSLTQSCASPAEVQCLTWTVGQRRARSERDGDRAFAQLVESARELVSHHFGADDGYELTVCELSGPVQGVRYVARSGQLQLLISVQRFVRGHAHGDMGLPPVEIRMVASLATVPIEGTAEPDRTLVGWGVAGCALWALGMSVLTLGSAGLIGTGLQAALLIPALLAWRACATGITGGVQRQTALRGARRTNYAAQIRYGIARWRAIVPALRAERDSFGERPELPPFRAPGRALRPTLTSAAYSSDLATTNSTLRLSS